MKALQVTGPQAVEIVDIPPPRPLANESLLQVQMVGMCGSDLNTYLGKNPLVSYPRILGHEIAARILEVPPSTAFAS